MPPKVPNMPQRIVMAAMIDKALRDYAAETGVDPDEPAGLKSLTEDNSDRLVIFIARLVKDAILEGKEVGMTHIVVGSYIDPLIQAISKASAEGNNDPVQ